MEVRGPLIWLFLMSSILGSMIISHNNDFVEAKSLSKFEVLEIEKKLKAINKPAVKIIKTIDGERYGCVDFFKQPAFDHPSMKNHTYHYKIRREMRERKTNNTAFGHLWENGVGCPIGTVPIRRVTRDDLLRLDSFGDNHKPRGSWNTTTYGPNSPLHNDNHHYAVARSKNPAQRFNGATMELCITAPKVKPGQYSASRLHIQIGNDFIQTGITINPVLYKDYQPRTFVYTYAGGKSCYNTNCDTGMILVREDFPLGSLMLPVSTRGDEISHFGIFGIIKDQINGNWWFEFGDQAEEIGFWPSSRFPQSFGNKVEWGGEVYSGTLPSPEMGYGYFPQRLMCYDAYIKRIAVLDNNFHVDRNVEYLEIFHDNDLYDVIDLTPKEAHNIPNAGHIIFYGGPGDT